MSQDSFRKEFETLRELGQSTFVLRGSTMIVELLPREEIKTSGGIIIASDSNQRLNSVENHRVDVARVLMTGPGYYVEEDSENSGGYEPLEIGPGAIILLPQYSAQLLSHFPGIARPTKDKLALVKFDQVLAYYPSEEAYELAKSKLNG